MKKDELQLNDIIEVEFGREFLRGKVVGRRNKRIFVRTWVSTIALDLPYEREWFFVRRPINFLFFSF